MPLNSITRLRPKSIFRLPSLPSWTAGLRPARAPGGARSNLVPSALVVALMLAACAPQPLSREGEACAERGEERVVAQMYFGRNIGGELGVSDEDWAAFVDAEITRRFPSGLTVTDAHGQWRDSESGAIVREPSKLLTVFLANEPRDRAALEAIADAYKNQFQQQAVAMVIERSCVSFE